MPAEQPSADLQSSFESYDRKVTINNIQLGCLIGGVLMPAGVVLDWFVYNKDVFYFLNLRLACSFLIGVFWLIVRSPSGRKHYKTLGVVLALIPAAFISMMIASENGATSPYYAGLNLVLLVVGFILHWNLRQSLLATASVLGMYLFACFWSNPRFLQINDNRALFANNVYFLALTAIVVVAGSGYHFRCGSANTPCSTNSTKTNRNSKRTIAS
jgi:two-component system sensor histidine kinase PhcS